MAALRAAYWKRSLGLRRSKSGCYIATRFPDIVNLGFQQILTLDESLSPAGVWCQPQEFFFEIRDFCQNSGPVPKLGPKVTFVTIKPLPNPYTIHWARPTSSSLRRWRLEIPLHAIRAGKSGGLD